MNLWGRPQTLEKYQRHQKSWSILRDEKISQQILKDNWLSFCESFRVVFTHVIWIFYAYLPANIYLFKVKHGNARTVCEICSKLTIKTRSGVLIVKFELISHIVLVFPLLTWTSKFRLGYNHGLLYSQGAMLWNLVDLTSQRQARIR